MFDAFLRLVPLNSFFFRVKKGKIGNHPDFDFFRLVSLQLYTINKGFNKHPSADEKVGFFGQGILLLSP